jgi:very-short-patch-repair endonuclease
MQPQCTCVICGAEFSPRPSKSGRYCSLPCYWVSKRKQPDTSCEVCGQRFASIPSTPSRFCSRSCRAVGLQRRETRTCLTCNQAFERAPHRPDRYCSPGCAANRERTPKAYPVKDCELCGQSFELRPTRKSHFCSRSCSDRFNKSPRPVPWDLKICAYCQTAFLCPPYHPEIRNCSNTCAKRYRALTVRGPNHPLYKEPIPVACEMCGKVRLHKPSVAPKVRACSRQCAAGLVQRAFPRVSSIERAMAEAFARADLPAIGQHPIDMYVADFAFPEARLVVECDGTYWHGRDRQQARDRQKDGYLHSRGWRVLRLPEVDIRTDPSACVERVISLLRESP